MRALATTLTTLLLVVAGCSTTGGGVGPATLPDELVGRTPAITPRSDLAPAPTRSPLAWEMDSADIDRIEDVWERTSMRFVQELVGEDRRRMLRHFGAPVLLTRTPDDPERFDYMLADERDAEADAVFLARVGPGVLSRPLRRALRELPIAADIEDAFDEFKADYDPRETEAREPGQPFDWGQFSVRVRASHASDPVELAWRRTGMMCGSSAERLRMRYEMPLGEEARASVSWRHDYRAAHDDVRLELEWRMDQDTLLHVVGGDGMRFLDGPTAWAQATSPLDGTPGLVFYVERIF